jgi:glycosyltransferase involved in cell wall biosynthesis
MENLPLVSIILCTYNGEQFLEQQLDSLINQTYPNIEVIICDDCSTDSTPDILKKYEGKNKIKVTYNKSNKGYTKNFEQAASLATGDYLAFCDQDDVWLPEKIKELMSAIGNYSLVYSDSILIDMEANSLNKKLSEVRNLQSVSDSRPFIFSNGVSGHTMIAKREVLDIALPIPEGRYHDWWIAARAATLNGVLYLDKCLTLYRQHPKTVTKTIEKKKLGSRTMSRRYADYLRDIEWIRLIMNNKHEKHKQFYDKLYRLFERKEKGYFVWPLFFLLYHYRDLLVLFPKKNYLSKVVEIRKICRGEKMYS